MSGGKRATRDRPGRLAHGHGSHRSAQPELTTGEFLLLRPSDLHALKPATEPDIDIKVTGILMEVQERPGPRRRNSHVCALVVAGIYVAQPACSLDDQDLPLLHAAPTAKSNYPQVVSALFAVSSPGRAGPSRNADAQKCPFGRRLGSHADGGVGVHIGGYSRSRHGTRVKRRDYPAGAASLPRPGASGAAVAGIQGSGSGRAGEPSTFLAARW